MTAAALITENNEKQVEKESEIILKSGTGNPLKTENLTNEKQSISNTKDLLKKAREAANQKFSMTINKDRNENLNKFHSPVMDRNVLKREESPAWYGQVIKTKLKRTAEPPSKKKTSMIADKMHKPDFSDNVQASKSLYDYYKKVRGEYEDFKEIEAARLQKRLEKFSDFPKNSKKTFEEFEREIVPWQNNSSAKTCYLCSDDFTLINRRHHCRLCGRIICSSPLCMENIPIKLENCLVKELKSCVKCFKFLFKKPQTRNQSLTEEKINSLFRRIKSLKSQLLETIPRFNEYLLEESITEARPLKEWQQDAWTLRDTLILYSVHFRSTVQELAEVAENEALEKPVFRVFANNLKRAGNEFLQKHMFTLQILDLNSCSSDCNKKEESNKQQIYKESNLTSPDSLKGQIKKLFPSIMNELFKVSSSSSEFGLVEFYSEEGDLIPLTDSEVIKEALGNKEQVLKEQLKQLEKEITRNSNNEKEKEKEEDSESREQTIKQAITDIKSELDRLQKLRI